MTFDEKEKDFYSALNEMSDHADYLHQELSVSIKKDVKKIEYDAKMAKNHSILINAHLFEQDASISDGFSNIRQGLQEVVDEFSSGNERTSQALLAKLQAIEDQSMERLQEMENQQVAAIIDNVSRVLLNQWQSRDCTESPPRPYVHPLISSQTSIPWNASVWKGAYHSRLPVPAG